MLKHSKERLSGSFQYKFCKTFSLCCILFVTFVRTRSRQIFLIVFCHISQISRKVLCSEKKNFHRNIFTYIFGHTIRLNPVQKLPDLVSICDEGPMRLVNLRRSEANFSVPMRTKVGLKQQKLQ